MIEALIMFLGSYIMIATIVVWWIGPPDDKDDWE